MKILTINRNYFITGGPEKYFFSLKEWLSTWEFIPFAVDFPQNFETPYWPYFVEPPSLQGASRFGDNRISLWRKMVLASRSIYSIEAKRKLIRLIDDTKPQAAFFLNAVYFSQSIVDACRKRKIPIIWRLSDFNLVCGNYLLCRDGETCVQCVGNGFSPILKNRCGGYQRSFSAAVVRYLGMQLSKKRHIYQYISFFVCPSKFMVGMLLKAGFPKEKLIYLPTFSKHGNFQEFGDDKVKKVLFIGRFSREKGLHTLIQAATRLKADNWRLILVGGNETDYTDGFDQPLPESIRYKVEFKGFLSQKEVLEMIKDCFFVVVPSVCYENLPNVVLESMAAGRSVIASRLGSLEETVTHGETGLLFNPGDPDDLAKKIDHLLSSPDQAKTMGKKAHQYVNAHYNVNNHITQLKQLFISAVQKESRPY